uniref:Bromodomain adjacent to zinc finger domain 2A n=1 Tax=Malurus cyaneus samueli TaxID=2593467 RepID=A0A8C5TIH5_9PASS
METNNHFNFTGLSSAPAASGPKPTPASGDSPFAHSPPLGFPPQGKSLNGGMNVNGFSTVSHPGTSGTFAPGPAPAAAQPLRAYDCLWDYTAYAPAGSLKDGAPATLGQFPLNGVAGGLRPASPGHGTNLRPAGQEFWANGNAGPMGLNFDSQELYESFHEQSFELMQNGPDGFYAAGQSSSALSSDAQPFPLAPDEPDPGQGDTDGAAKEMPATSTATIAENGGGLVGSQELEEAQPELKMCSYNGAAAGAGSLGPEGPVLAPRGDASPIAPRLQDTPMLSEDTLEPFESLARGRGVMDGHRPPSLHCPSHPRPTHVQFPVPSTVPPRTLVAPISPHPASKSLSPCRHAAPATIPLRPSCPRHCPFPSCPCPVPSHPARVPTPPIVPQSRALPCPVSGTIPCSSRCPRVAVPFGAILPPVPRPCPPILPPTPPHPAPRPRADSAVPRWRREVRIKKGNHRWQGETWYYGPCGKRMKQFPEVIKYLSRNMVQDVRREHFSFSPRMPVGDFYEERDTPEGAQWVKLSPEEIPGRIQAITGKRGRPRNAEKAKAKEPPATKRGRGRPPKLRMVLSDEDKLKMSKIKKKMRRKRVLFSSQAKNKQKQEAKTPRAKEAKKKPKAKEKKGKPEKGKDKARPKEKKAKGARKAEKGPQAQRRLEERQRQQLILEEMKKPTEDMCLGDHQPLPALSRIPGLVLPGRAFSDCLTVVEFLQSYGRVLGMEPARDVPSLGALQEGLLGVAPGAGQLQDLLVRLLQAALCDPGLPPYCQSLKILGEKVSEISLNRDTVSEVLRCFLMAHGAGAELCEGLRTKPFQALPPERKAAILVFLVNELNSSALIVSEIDKTLENMSNYRKNKWIIEGRLRRLKVALAKKTGRPESEITGLEDGRRRRSSRLTEDTGLDVEEEEETRGRRSPSSVPELERQIEKLAKRQMFFRKKLLHSSQTLRAASLGQDRFRRRYWVLPHLGGIFVEGAEGEQGRASQEPPEDEKVSPALVSPLVSPLKEEPAAVPVASRTSCPPAPASASRARGRPRKGKEELAQHCGAHPAHPAHPTPLNGVLEEPEALAQSQHDLSQSAFLSWLSQTQSALLKDSVLTPASSPGKGDTAPPPGPWFNLLPRTPCDGRAAPLNGLPSDDPAAPLLASTPVHAGPRAHGACPRSRGGPDKLQDTPGQPKRRGRPPTKFFKQMEQKYLTQLTEQPVPAEMQSGWWWLREPEELEAVTRALHPRGIREKALHKHLTKHREFLREVCLRATTDPIFHPRSELAAAVSQEALAQWSVPDRAYETDLGVLQWVEELEQRVLMADLQIRGWTCPSPDSTRTDLRYCEHKVEPLEDITVRSRRDGLPPRRELTNPLDLAVLRLAALEQNLERRYLKEPLWPLHEVVLEKAVLSGADELSLGPTEIAYEITPRVRTWRQTLERCRSAAQVSLCIFQLEKSIAWEKSVNRVSDRGHLTATGTCSWGQ